MRYLPTILLTLLTALIAIAAAFIAIDGNLVRLTGWHRIKKGDILFSEQKKLIEENANWMRIESLHEKIECQRQADGTWWITSPYYDRMSKESAESIIAFSANTKLVDTLPLNNITRSNMREFGVETKPFKVTIKDTDGAGRSTLARYTLGSAAPWYSDVGDGKSIMPTIYMRSNYFGRDKRIHVVTGNVLKDFRDGLRGLRDLQIMRCAEDDILKIDIKSDDKTAQNISLERASAQSDWVIQTPIITQGDNYSITRLLRSLSKLKALRIQDSNDIKLNPLDRKTEITIQTTDGKSRSIILYKEFYSSNYDCMVQYATISDRSAIFTLQVAPRITRTGGYSQVINAIFEIPIFEPNMMQKIRNTKGISYTQDIPLDFKKLRSRQFCKLELNEISRIALRSSYDSQLLRLLLIPGDKKSEVSDVWMYSIDNSPYKEAELSSINNLLVALSRVPVVDFIEEIPMGAQLFEIYARHGLDQPDHTITVLPKQSNFRSLIYGINVSLIKDGEPRSFLIKRKYDPIKDEHYSIGTEYGSNTIYKLSTKLTQFLTQDESAWKKKQLMHFPTSTLRKLSLIYQQATLAVEYDYIGEGWKGRMGGKDITPSINPQRAHYYVRNLQKMRAFTWLNKDDKAAIKALRKPVFTVKLELEHYNDSMQEAIIIEQSDDKVEELIVQAHTDSNEQSQENSDESDIDRRMRDQALSELDIVKSTITLEIAPINLSPKSKFYGRIKETGELFIISNEDANSLANSFLEL